jgi:transcriptional regulator with XRE-family HTH domain
MPKPTANPQIVLDLRKRMELVAKCQQMRQLAEYSGVNYHTLIKIHNGQTPNPTVDTFLRVERAVNNWTPEGGFNSRGKSKPRPKPRQQTALVSSSFGA